MIPLYKMSNEDKRRFVYNPGIKPTSQELDNYPELCDGDTVIPKLMIPITYTALTPYNYTDPGGGVNHDA